MTHAFALYLLALAAQTPVKPIAARDDGIHLTPLGRTGNAKHAQAILTLAEKLRATPAPDLTEREEKESASWMRAANPEIHHTLVGHRVVVLATEAFAARARENHLTLNLDMAFEVYRDLTGIDPMARTGRRFFIWPDPEKPNGLSCVGREIRIHVGRSAFDNADCFEDFFHEMFHGFQFENPAGSFMCGGLFEGWAQFAQAIAVDALSPLGEPFTKRFAWYAERFPNSARQEYLQTRLSIEEIVAYDPSSGLLMELVKTTFEGTATPQESRSPEGGVAGVTTPHPDWTPIRQWLRGALEAKPWVPPELWPALFARETLRRFDPVKAKPILVKYRFPVDKASLGAVDTILLNKSHPILDARVAVRDWLVNYPVTNGSQMGLEWDPFDRENASTDPLIASQVGFDRGVKVPVIAIDTKGILHLDRAGNTEPRIWSFTGKLPDKAKGPLTLFIASSDDVAVYLDSELVHLYRGTRACDPSQPDVVYVNSTGSGKLFAVLANSGGESSFHVAVSPGGLFFEGIDELMGSSVASDREAAASYLATRRPLSLTRNRLLTLLTDSGAKIRASAAWGLAGHRDDPAVVETLVKVYREERDPGARQSLRECLEELTFESFATAADADRWWKKNAAAFAARSYAEAESAYARGSIRGGFFGNQEGAYGRQCVARAWGADAANWLSVVLTARTQAPLRLRIRYACAIGPSSLHVRIRRGDTIVFEKESLELPTTGAWTNWKWIDVELPALAKGRHHVELLDPRGGPDIDVVGWVPR